MVHDVDEAAHSSDPSEEELMASLSEGAEEEMEEMSEPKKRDGKSEAKQAQRKKKVAFQVSAEAQAAHRNRQARS